MSERGGLMASEMGEQPGVLQRLGTRRPEIVAELRGRLPRTPAGIVLIARGSSDHAALHGRYLLELVTGRPVALAAPSLLTRYDVRGDLGGWLAVGVSQSGKTPEIVDVLQRMRAEGACTVAITNDSGSPIADAADVTLSTEAGAERAVPATKTFTAQVAAFALLAEALGDVPWREEDWERLPGDVAGLLADLSPARETAALIGDAPAMVCAARGLLIAAAHEAALKLKEVTGTLAEGASAADFLHGPIAVVHPGFPVLCFAAPGPAREDIAELIDAVRVRGGRPLLVSSDRVAELRLPASTPEGLAVIPAVVRAQQLAREIGLMRGLDPDTPFDLAKVTSTH